MSIRINSCSKALGLLAFGISACTGAAYGQAYGYVDLPPKPRLTVDAPVFDCAKSFDGSGTGACRGQLNLQFYNAPRPLKTVVYRCTLTFKKAFKQNTEFSNAIEMLEVEKKVAGDGLTSNVTILDFSKDFTSLSFPVKYVYLYDTRCQVNYTYAS